MRNAIRIVAAFAVAAPLSAQISLEPIGTYASGVFAAGAAEIGAYDAGSQRLFVTNADANTLDVLDLSDPTNPTLLLTVDFSTFGGGVNSVAVHDGLVAAAVEGFVKTDPGTVVFLDTDGDVLKAVAAGALPDMLTFSEDGQYVVVANEGEPSDDYTVDPEGSVTIINLSQGVAGLNPSKVKTARFHKFNNAVLDPSIRIYGPGASVAQDLEPEYIAIGPFGIAWVACQENNALAIVDLKTARVLGLFGLGLKDHSQPGNALDPSNQDGGIHIANWPVHGMYQPDALGIVTVLGFPFVLSANEGDARGYPGFSEEIRIRDLVLDPTVFPPELGLQANSKLGRLNSTIVGGDPDDDGDKDQLFAYGARSMSVWSPFGELVWDSGDLLEQVTAAELPTEFNSTHDANGSFDNRSDDKGPEPEGLTTGRVGERTYAFLGLERIGGIAVFDVTKPWAPVYVDYVNNRDFAGVPAAGTAGDLGPEGLIFIAAVDSPTGEALLVVTQEISGTTTVWRVTQG